LEIRVGIGIYGDNLVNSVRFGTIIIKLEKENILSFWILYNFFKIIKDLFIFISY